EVQVRAQEAQALRHAARQAQAQDPGCAQEGQETGAVLRLIAAGWSAEWSRVREILARHTHSPMGRERALNLEPRSDLPAIASSLSETREGRQPLAIAGTPPSDSLPDVREPLEPARVAAY